MTNEGYDKCIATGVLYQDGTIESLDEDSSEGSIAKMYTITMKRLWYTGNLIINGVHHLGANEHTPRDPSVLRA